MPSQPAACPSITTRTCLLSLSLWLLLFSLACQKPTEPAPPTPESPPPIPNRPQLVQNQSSRTSLALNKVFFLDAQTGWVVGRNGALLHTTDGGTTWQPQPSGTDENLIDIFFVNRQRGWALSVSRLFATTDGGRTWRDIWDTSTIELTDEATTSVAVEVPAALITLSFATPTHGWALALGWDPTTSRYSVPLILMTSNGGGGWDWQELKESYSLINAIDRQTCLIAGKNGRIMQTTDGGRTWTPRTSLTDDDLTAVYFSTPQQGWAVGRRGTIITTNDGGQTWGLAHQSPAGARPVELHAIRFTDAQHGVAAGYVDHSKDDQPAYLLTMVLTSDGGRSWQRQEISGAYFVINSLKVMNPQAAWAIGSGGQILRFRTAE